MTATIVDRGCGPEIAGTRIAVYDIWVHARLGHHHTCMTNSPLAA